MQEWMIAMFIVSILLILRDMAKTVFSDMRKSAATVIYEEHPQKERMRRYAAAFQKLADSFYGLPYRKDYISNGELEDMIRQLRDGHLQKLYGGKTLLGRTSFADVSDFISSASFDGKTGCTENHVGKSEFNRVLYQSGENDGTDAEADGTTEANPDLE